MSLFQLFFVFMYIGFFAVGGGLVAASFMQNVLVNQYGLISAENFTVCLQSAKARLDRLE